MYLIDAPVLLDMRHADEGGPHAALAQWARRTAAHRLFLSAQSLIELDEAADRAARRSRDAGAAWRQWIDGQVLPAFDGRILAVDLAVARRRARLNLAGQREGVLAATAIEHGLSLVTYDGAAFRGARVKLLDPKHFAPAEPEPDWRTANQSSQRWLKGLFVRG